MKPTIAVAISGGVDSMIAAYLLKEQGYRVIGIHFVTGFETDDLIRQSSKGPVSGRIADIGKQLGTAIELLDCRAEFRQTVVNYFIRTYLAGQTPNPCMACNPIIKFGAVLSFARELGAERLATGHYARIKKDRGGKPRLFKGIDIKKDQSYFLARLTRQQLSRACFPLGGLSKSAVKQLAKEKGLHPLARKESQDVCFIKDGAYGEFLSKQTGFKSEPGFIVNAAGKILGQHQGLHLFTIGQRRGINCPAAEPYYVLQLDRERNRLVVGSKSALLVSKCRVTDINWIQDDPDKPIKIQIRVRYRHKEVAGTLFPADTHAAEIRFESPQTAITPGQAAVFYKKDEVLGGGWIDIWNA
jgi:tRNA-specific 2-thiouridylase